MSLFFLGGFFRDFLLFDHIILKYETLALCLCLQLGFFSDSQRFNFCQFPSTVVQFREKFAFCKTRFATQHSFATPNCTLWCRIVSEVNCTLWGAKKCWVANLVLQNANFSWNCTTSMCISNICLRCV